MQVLVNKIDYKKVNILNFETVSKRLNNIRETLSSKYGLIKIGIFGSVARDEQNDNSDVDILVELSQKISLLKFSGLYVDIEEELNTKVDVVDINDLRPELAEIIKNEVRYI